MDTSSSLGQLAHLQEQPWDLPWHYLRKSPMNLIFMHQIQLLGQKLGFFWFLLGFSGKVAGFGRGL